jgi:hypothetical protein
LLYTICPRSAYTTRMLKPALQSVVEQLCEDGCKRVSRYIREIAAGDYPRQMRKLNPQECDEVMAELKSIMAVYDRRSD